MWKTKITHGWNKYSPPTEESRIWVWISFWVLAHINLSISRFPHLKNRRGNSKHLPCGYRLKGVLSVKGREGALYTAWREGSGEASSVSLCFPCHCLSLLTVRAEDLAEAGTHLGYQWLIRSTLRDKITQTSKHAQVMQSMQGPESRATWKKPFSTHLFI